MMPLLDVVTAVCSAGESTVLGIPTPESEDHRLSLRFDVALLNRGMNAAKAARLLCGEAFWEEAAGAVRQMFELLLAAEHVGRQHDRKAAVTHYVRFGLLQRVKVERADLAYREASGREVDREHGEFLDGLLARGFPEFRTAKGRWDTTWTGLTTRALAESSRNRLRVSQYELLYSDWSDQLHASPGVVIGSIFLTDQDFDAVVASDDVRCAELIGSVVNLLIELWHELPEIPNPDPLISYQWHETLLQWAARYGGAERVRSRA